jgi:pimeloyl-ACP methyl ester carboxylesterase
VGTVVAMEGGPGYPSTGTAPDFLDMIGPLHADHDLLLVDARGSGRSTPMDCAPLQAYGGSTATDHFRALVRACADQLDRTWQRSDGSWVQAADLFGTANVARDLAGVVTAMGLGRVDLYGDSYGSWFAQVFTARYPQLLRSVTLDSTYEVRDLDPWYLTSVQTARTAFDAACARSIVSCRNLSGFLRTGFASCWKRSMKRRTAIWAAISPASFLSMPSEISPGRHLVQRAVCWQHIKLELFPDPHGIERHPLMPISAAARP